MLGWCSGDYIAIYLILHLQYFTIQCGVFSLDALYTSLSSFFLTFLLILSYIYLLHFCFWGLFTFFTFFVLPLFIFPVHFPLIFSLFFLFFSFVFLFHSVVQRLQLLSSYIVVKLDGSTAIKWQQCLVSTGAWVQPSNQWPDSG